MPSKIEGNLNPEQFWDFCEAVAQMKGGRKGATLKQIKQLAGEWGITISENSAKSFRDGAFKDFLDELKADREFADDVAMVAQAGSNLPDAAANVLSKKIFQTTLKLGDNIDPETADAMTKSVERLRTGNRMGRRLESDLVVANKKIEVADKQLLLRDQQIEKLQREKKEWDERQAKIKAAVDTAAKKGGITPDTRKLIEAAMKGEAA